ncbi:2053_t:CDS:2 [Ambispora gerdemannii]|uniref:2053_t:CDS:1 n=1 Tax=Ambispora gerdemannii TaxID=144530 RepID=A0A9N9ED32_9GLOM|nr:2053_t:CDS:2 [Ambispora gerdemannii]
MSKKTKLIISEKEIDILAEKSLREAKNFSNVEIIRKKYLEKGGVISQLFQQISQERDLDKRKKLDIYLEGKKYPLASLHPITQIIQKIYAIFLLLGYQVAESTEIETEEYNFNKLNIPTEHPARDMHDTFYLNANLLLRTHTSNTQIRVMESNPNQELKVITAGKVYRRDEDDATHTHQFTQIEGFVVGRDISFSHLKAWKWTPNALLAKEKAVISAKKTG